MTRPGSPTRHGQPCSPTCASARSPAGRWSSTRWSTRRPATTATTTAADSAHGALLRQDDTVASVVAARPALGARRAATRIGQRPWADLAPTQPRPRLRRRHGGQRRPGRAHAAQRPRASAGAHPGDRLRQGRRRRRDGRAAGRFAAASPGPPTATRRAGTHYLIRSARRRARCAHASMLREPLRPVADGARRAEDKQHPRRRGGLADDAVGVGHADPRGHGELGPVPPGLAARPLPRGHRPARGRRPRRRRPPGGLPVAGAEARRLVVAEHRGERHRYWTSLQLDEVSLPMVLAWQLGRHGAADWGHVRARGRLHRGQRPADRAGALGEPGRLSPNTIAAEIAGLVCARTSPRRNGDRARAQVPARPGRQLAARSRRWTATEQRAVLRQPVLPAGDQGRPSRTTAPPTRSATTSRSRWTSVGGRPELPRPGPVRRQVRDDPVDAQLARGRRPAARGSTTPDGPIWHRFNDDGYGEQPTAADGTSSTPADADARSALAAAERRARRVRTARRAAARRRQAGDDRRTANDGADAAGAGVGRPAPAGAGGPHVGEGTRSATPLAWTHAQFIRLAWSIDAGKPIERPAVVACRYTGDEC